MVKWNTHRITPTIQNRFEVEDAIEINGIQYQVVKRQYEKHGRLLQNMVDWHIYRITPLNRLKCQSYHKLNCSWGKINVLILIWAYVIKKGAYTASTLLEKVMWIGNYRRFCHTRETLTLVNIQLVNIWLANIQLVILRRISLIGCEVP